MSVVGPLVKGQLCLIKLVGVPPGVFAVTVCVNVGSIWAWHREPVLDGEVGVSPVSVTFEPCQVLLWAWDGVKGEAMAGNEAEHIVWKVRREERLPRCEVGVTVVRWCCYTHTGNEVSSCVGRVVERLRSLCVYFGPMNAVRF